MRTAAFLAGAIALVLFGSLALFSIGFPFLLTGLLMLASVAFRGRLDIMVPALLWPWVFTLGYVLVGPLGCATSATAMVPNGVGDLAAVTRCSALLFAYIGESPYAPLIWPGLLVGAALATAVALLLQRAMRRRRTLAVG